MPMIYDPSSKNQCLDYFFCLTSKSLIDLMLSVDGHNKLRVEKCFSTPGMAPHLGKVL